RRPYLAQRSLVPPSSNGVKDFSLRYATEFLDPSWVSMGDTLPERTMLMFPHERKIILGPFDRLPCNVSAPQVTLGTDARDRLFTHQPVRFISLDNIAFTRPVPTGFVVSLT
ncbi:hypothetical protein H4582DRAFT_1776643, partial [Lactarius indigo]